MNCKKSLLFHSSPCIRKAFRCSQHHIIIAARAVDHQYFAVFVASYGNAYMRIIWIKEQIAWQYFRKLCGFPKPLLSQVCPIYCPSR